MRRPEEACFTICFSMTGMFMEGRPENIFHPRTALENAEKYFSLTERERNLILRHMWPLTPLPPKYREGYVVIYADKLCSLEEIWLSVRKKLGAALKAA